MKLEVKHIAPYLPYDLQHLVKKDDGEFIETLKGISYGNLVIGGNKVDVKGYPIHLPIPKPILRPLSDLDVIIETNRGWIIPLDVLKEEDKDFTKDFIEVFGYEECKYEIIEKLLEWHFDVFGLIEQGLAVDINTIKASS
jgi:hypothetical protein